MLTHLSKSLVEAKVDHPMVIAARNRPRLPVRLRKMAMTASTLTGRRLAKGRVSALRAQLGRVFSLRPIAFSGSLTSIRV